MYHDLNMARGLTKKEKGFVKDYVKTGNGTQSALKNYDTDDEDVAAVIASHKLGKVKIQDAIKVYADRIPDELLEKVHLEGLQATRRTTIKVLGEDDSDEEILEPDYAVRHKYLDTAYKVKGSFAPERKDVTIREQIPLDIV